MNDERNKHEYDLKDMPAPSLTGHMWRQLGNKLECTSCNFTHFAFLQPGQYISGYEEGIPVISKLQPTPKRPPFGGRLEPTD